MAKGNTISPPVKCSNMDCNHPAYQEVDSYRELHDYQEVKIQEPAQGLDVGCIPRSITMILLDDLVDTCKPGDDVEVTCSILRRWQPVSTEVKCVIEVRKRGTSTPCLALAPSDCGRLTLTLRRSR